MKHKLLSLFVALIATGALWASNTITYTATEKLRETISEYDGGLHIDAFNVGISSHTFSNGTGTITFYGEVTTIGEWAFFGCRGVVTSITIPNSVTTIGDYAFCYCSGLTSVIIPNSVTTIGIYAFRSCSGLTSITIPNSVTTIGNHAFSGCSSLTSVSINSNAICSKNYTSSSNFETIFGNQVKEYIIGNSVTAIGGYAFEGCSGLTSVTIPNSVTTIGDYAFFGCSGLTSITIPNFVRTIGKYAFYGCSGLTSITIPNSVTTIGNAAFFGCSGLTSITIPNSVTTIGDYAFEDCSGLTSVTIGNSVTTIGQYAFQSCSGLTSVTIPNSVTTIGNDAFRDCSGLTSVSINSNAICSKNYASSSNFETIFGNQVKEYIIGNSVTAIGGYAFSGCSGLTSITFPNSVTTIGEYAFVGCHGLTSVTIPNSVTTIGENAFYACSGLTSVTIPSSVTTIGDFAFCYCSGLTSFDVATGNTHYCSVDGVLFNYAKDILVQYPASNPRTEYTIPNSVTRIGSSAFSGCSSLTSVTIPNSVTTIGNEAFGYCYNLTRVTLNSDVITWKTYSSSNNLTHIFGSQVKTYIIGNDVYSIGEYAFYGSDKITNLGFGSNLTTIGKSAFANCNRIDTMTIYAVEPPIITETTFKNVSRYAFLYVPKSSERKYKTDAYWSYFDIQTISAKDTPISGNEVVVLPSTDNATFTWPQNDQAAGYSIEITKDGVVFCTLKFNAQGQLTGIAFAPSRGGSREMAAAEMTASGWQFTVTGLDQASKYGYTLDVTNASQQSIKHYEGEFTTTGATGLEWLTVDNAQYTIRKMIIDNQLFIFRGDKIYNAAGVLIK